ncbi:HTH protein, partial [Acromyrmex charruanus]
MRRKRRKEETSKAVLSRGSGGNMGNQLAEERRHRAVRYEASSIVDDELAVAAGFNSVVTDTLLGVIAKHPQTCRAMSLPSRPPSSSLSYPGAGANDDARSPGSGGTPGPLSQQAPASLDSSDPGKFDDRCKGEICNKTA